MQSRICDFLKSSVVNPTGWSIARLAARSGPIDHEGRMNAVQRFAALLNLRRSLHGFLHELEFFFRRAWVARIQRTALRREKEGPNFRISQSP
jgi:hypothetical protein